VSNLTHMCTHVVKENPKMASSVLFSCLCYRCRATLATYCDQCRLLAMGFGPLLSTGTRASVPQQPFGRHSQLLPSSHRLPLLHSVRRRQETHLQTLFTRNLLQYQDSKLPLAVGCSLPTQRYNKTGESAITHMWTGQVYSTRDEEERLHRLHTLLYLHQRNF